MDSSLRTSCFAQNDGARQSNRHCEALKKPKQSILVNIESYVNRLLLVKLWLNSKSNDLLIQFSIIDFICLLDSRDLDTSLHCVPLSMTKWWRFVFDSWIALIRVANLA